MKIFITGGAGFIGSHIAEEYLLQGHEVTVYDNFSTGKIENTSYTTTMERPVVVEGDIRDFSLLEQAIAGHDIIFHQAAVASVQQSIENPRATFEVNAGGTLNVLEAAKIHGARKVLFACSAAIFGDQPDLPKTEGSPVKPIAPYGADKYISETYLRLYNELYGLPTVSMRYFNVFGPRQDPSSPYSGVISIFTTRISEDKDVTVYGDGNQYRDFIYVKDVVKANMLAAEKETSKFEFYNAGYGKATSLNDLLAMLKDIYGKDITVHYEAPRQGDIRESVSDNTRLCDQLGFTPSFTVKQGLEALVSSL